MNRWQQCFKQNKLWKYIKDDRQASIAVMGIISEYDAFNWLQDYFGPNYLVEKNGSKEPDFTVTNLKTGEKKLVEFKRSKNDKFRFVQYHRDKEKVKYSKTFCDFVLVDRCDKTSTGAKYYLVPSDTIGTDPKEPNSLMGNVDIKKSVPITKLF